MTKTILKLAAALAVTVAGLPAQTGVVTGGSSFQQAGAMGRGGAGWVAATPGGRGAGPQVVTGKPLAATEERKTVQTLADGTQLENADSNLFYRDSQGRTRVERTLQGKTTIRITDPVAHTSSALDPATKTVRKTSTVTFQQGAAVTRSGRGGLGTPSADGLAAGQAAIAQDPRPASEDLGVQTLNGVAAQGTRDTQTIPAGRIGNNRDIHVVYERWYSIDLQMLVKSVNTDPRFGVTTYQLTNIVQGAPDPALFQIPADYTVVGNGQ